MKRRRGGDSAEAGEPGWALVAEAASAGDEDDLDVYHRLCAALEETEVRGAALDAALRGELCAATMRAAAARSSSSPRAALILLDGALLRCRSARDVDRLHAAAAALDPPRQEEEEEEEEEEEDVTTASLDVFPDLGMVVAPGDDDALEAHRLPRGTPVRRVATVRRGGASWEEDDDDDNETAAPTVYEGAALDWPAVGRWRSPGYLKASAGGRVVPVEVGALHLDNVTDFTGPFKQQRLVTFGDFVDHLQAAASGPSEGGKTTLLPFLSEACAVSEIVPVTSARTIAYLAQHRLFDQVLALRGDIPELFLPGADGPASSLVARLVRRGPRHPAPPLINAWFGPAGVVTPLHFDHHPNLLCHFVGLKLVLLWPPDAPLPRHSPPNDNTSPLDVEGFSNSPEGQTPLPPTTAVVLRPGDVLLIPKGVWHYVRTLTTAFSVSVWY